MHNRNISFQKKYVFNLFSSIKSNDLLKYRKLERVRNVKTLRLVIIGQSLSDICLDHEVQSHRAKNDSTLTFYGNHGFCSWFVC